MFEVPSIEIARAVDEWSNKTLRVCYQCGICTARCPLSRSSNFSVRMFNNKFRLGLCDFKTDEMWLCTTCRNCVNYCPCGVNVIDFITSLRRVVVERGSNEASQQVMETGSVPSTVVNCLENLALFGNPQDQPPSQREEWAYRLDVRTARRECPDSDRTLYWVGCLGAYDPLGTQISLAMISLLENFGINYIILGIEERCCGDPALRLGEDGLFRQLALENIKVLNKYKIKKIITHCPHCYNMLKNEYPKFGGQFEVLHHSELLLSLLEAGKTKLSLSRDQLVTFHDPCYLGRYNNLYTSPRQVIQSLPGVRLIEMEYNHESSMCCGGGGGQIWIGLEKGTRVNYMRFEHILKTGAKIVVTACPFCKMMMEDAAIYNGVINEFKIKDIAELFLEFFLSF